MLLSLMANLFLIPFAAEPPGCRQSPVRKTHALGFAQNLSRDRLHGMFLQLKLHVINFFELIQKPRIDRSHLRYLLDGVALTQRVANVGKSLGMRSHQALGKNLRLYFLSPDALASVERANRFHQRFFKSSPDGLDFATEFHWRTKLCAGSGNFS